MAMANNQPPFLDGLIATTIAMIPGVGWWEGFLSFDATVVVYLAIIAAMAGHGLNQKEAFQKSGADQ
jgi:hypothetical protein